ncbi:hypothetical protein [Deferrisoma sp.]
MKRRTLWACVAAVAAWGAGMPVAQAVDLTMGERGAREARALAEELETLEALDARFDIPAFDLNGVRVHAVVATPRYRGARRVLAGGEPDTAAADALELEIRASGGPAAQDVEAEFFRGKARILARDRTVEQGADGWIIRAAFNPEHLDLEGPATLLIRVGKPRAHNANYRLFRLNLAEFP